LGRSEIILTLNPGGEEKNILAAWKKARGTSGVELFGRSIRISKRSRKSF